MRCAVWKSRSLKRCWMEGATAARLDGEVAVRLARTKESRTRSAEWHRGEAGQCATKERTR
eukprot:scaffold24117_cov31-Tisochrysis_lutea.AAC.3